MGYLALAILIGVIIWTFWRLFTHKRIPLNYFTTQDNTMNQKSDEIKESPSKTEEDTYGK